MKINEHYDVLYIFDKRARSMRISGCSGCIECIVEEPRLQAQAVWLISHPHPLQEGTMHNKVVYTLSRCALQNNAVSVRYNFRGVGGSEGVFSHSFLEQDDLHSVFEWVVKAYPALPIVLAGFSFGAYISLLALNTKSPAAVVVIAPPIGKPPYNSLLLPKIHYPTLLVVGKQDNVIDPFVCLQWAVKQDGLDAYWLNQADHFFNGRLVVLKKAINQWYECNVKL